MKILVTGASGFLGQYVVAAALKQGHDVAALVRPKTQVEKFSWSTHPNLSVVRHDLRQLRGLDTALTGVDTVIHLAATKAGDFYTQFAGTVIATENLLSAMAAVGISRLVAISTFSVYDYLKMRPWQRLDESSPIVSDSQNRDEYAQTKLIQEDLYRTFEKDHNAQVTILRPGMIYGRNNLWHALIGAEVGGNRWLKIGGWGILPMIYVENCAEAIAQAVTAESAMGHTLNLVDDKLPNQQTYIKLLLRYTENPPKLTPFGWLAMKTMADLAWWVNRQFLGSKGRLPGMFVPAKVHARFKPLRYTNTLAKDLLGWSSKYSIEEAFERSNSEKDLLSVSLPDISPETININEINQATEEMILAVQ